MASGWWTKPVPPKRTGRSFLEQQKARLEMELASIVSDILATQPRTMIPMSERETDRNALTPYAASYPAQVQAAGRQLAIAAQLNQDLERGGLSPSSKRVSSEVAAYDLSIVQQTLDRDLIERFADHWVWSTVTQNNPALVTGTDRTLRGSLGLDSSSSEEGPALVA